MEKEKPHIPLKEQLTALGYTPYEAAQAAGRAEQMDGELRRELEQWLADGTLPVQEHEGFTVLELTEQRGFTVPAAFLFLDWLKKEPEAARLALAAMTDQII